MRLNMTIVAPRKLFESQQFKKASKAQQDNFALFCNVILMKGGVDSFDRQFKPVSCRSFSRFIRAKRLREIRKRLISAGVIECDNEFSYRKQGCEVSLGYRFHADISSDSFEAYEPRSKWSRDRIERITRDAPAPSLTRRGEFKEIHSTLTSMLSDFVLDLGPASDVVCRVPLGKRPSAEIQLLNFHYRQFYAVVGSTGRFYSNLSNLRKDLREILKVKAGGRLSETVTPDVSCCQPLCLNVFLRKEISKREFTLHLELTETGELYSAIAKAIGCSRAQVKASYVKYLYGPSFREKSSIQPAQLRDPLVRQKFETLNRIAEWYRTRLPETDAYLRRIKTSTALARQLNKDRRGKRKRGFAIVANMLQRIESEIVIDHCCSQLVTDFREMPIATVHDGILCPQEGRTAVVEQLVKSFKNRGLNPNIV